MKVKIKKLSDSAIIPTYATPGSAGFDLHANTDVFIATGQTLAIPTGLAFEVPLNYELQVRPRSGISLKTELRVILGTVDSDYRGEVKIIIQNVGREIDYIRKHERIAQAILSPIVQTEFEVVDELNTTERGSNGFGSTGL
jgi:dUTP pyrophosphatase